MKKLLYIIITAGFLASCSSVSMIGSWSDPQAKEIQSDKVAVFGVTSRIDIRQNVENQMVSRLKEKNVDATGSLGIFTPDMKDAGVMESKLIEQGYEMAITLSLMDSKQETRYVPGTAYAPAGAYYGFRGYVGYGYGAVYSPGYYETSEIYYIECNAYTLPEGKLVYSSQTKTVDPTNVDKFSYELAAAIVKDMTSQGLLPAKK